MRNLIDLVERNNTAMLMESMLLEYHQFGQQQLAPAFAALYEEVRTRQAQRDVTDRILRDILSQHGGDITAAIAAIQSHKIKNSGEAPSLGDKPAAAELVADPSARLAPPAVKKSAVSQVKHALEQWYSLANRKSPLVAKADTWIESKIREITGQIDQIDDLSKFGPYKQKLRKSVRWFSQYRANHPKKSMLIVATLGVISGLIGSGMGMGWVVPAVMMVIRLAMMVINGEKFSSAVTKVLSTSGLAVLAGVGLGALFNSIFSLQASAAAAPAASGTDALSQTDAVRELPGTGSTPSVSDAQPMSSTPYIDQLRNVVDPSGEGTGIPTMTQSRFADAWRAAREAMGAGNVFVWNGQPYTTNTRQEGLLSGLSDAAKRFLRGGR